jgi:hypothetical protein
LSCLVVRLVCFRLAGPSTNETSEIRRRVLGTSAFLLYSNLFSVRRDNGKLCRLVPSLNARAHAVTAFKSKRYLPVDVINHKPPGVQSLARVPWQLNPAIKSYWPDNRPDKAAVAAACFNLVIRGVLHATVAI